MSEYTEGPWRYQFLGGDILILPEEEPNIALARVHKQSMNLSGRGCAPYPSVANARLIAAAPDLYECAKEILRVYDEADAFAVDALENLRAVLGAVEDSE